MLYQIDVYFLPNDAKLLGNCGKGWWVNLVIRNLLDNWMYCEHKKASFCVAQVINERVSHFRHPMAFVRGNAASQNISLTNHMSQYSDVSNPLILDYPALIILDIGQGILICRNLIKVYHDPKVKQNAAKRIFGFFALLFSILLARIFKISLCFLKFCWPMFNLWLWDTSSDMVVSVYVVVF